jgi:hypothetical protein
VCVCVCVCMLMFPFTTPLPSHRRKHHVPVSDCVCRRVSVSVLGAECTLRLEPCLTPPPRSKETVVLESLDECLSAMKRFLSKLPEPVFPGHILPLLVTCGGEEVCE